MAQSYTVTSPAGNLSMTIGVDERLTYSIFFEGKAIIKASTISMTLESGSVIGAHLKVMDQDRRAVDETLAPVVAEKRSTIRDAYTQLSLSFDGGWGLDIRAYDDGGAYRFRTTHTGDLIIISDELLHVVIGACIDLVGMRVVAHPTGKILRMFGGMHAFVELFFYPLKIELGKRLIAAMAIDTLETGFKAQFTGMREILVII